MNLHDAIAARYLMPGPEGDVLRSAVENACEAFLASGQGDPNARQKLSSPDDATYWQQLSEVLVARELTNVGLSISHPRAGPDILLEHEGRRIWIEVICPEPTGLPAEWTNADRDQVRSLPHEAILLRWTAAIKQKAERLLGNATAGVRGYLESGIVHADDGYVIAVNARLLRAGTGFPELFGISQFPYAVEATFSVGPIQVHIDRNTLATVGTDHQHRPLIPKPAGRSVPADTFLDPRFAPVSAIWATDVDENLLLGITRPMVVVHNPQARVALPRNLLPAQYEYVALDHTDHYQLDRHKGRLG